MANIIRPKRSNTAAKVPNTTELTSGELGVNMADRKVYINNGTAVVQVGAGNVSGLGDVAIATPTNGQALTYNSTTSKWQNSSAGTGTVTSVGITPGTGVTVSGSPVTTSGNIAVGLSTKLTAIENLSGAGFITQNGTGVIAGRTLQAGTGISIAHGNGSSQDPIITNSAPDQTVVLTGAGATSITGTYPNFTISSVNTTYGAATSTVPGLIELGSDTAQTVAANAVSATASRSYALQVNAAGQGVVNVPWTDTNSGGTVTSVALSGGTTGLTTSGGPITTSGTITLAGTLAVANGGTGATTAAAARTNLGATTLGGNLYTLANVAAIAFPRFNADNTVSSLDAASFRTAIGAGTSSTTGTVTSVGGTGTVSGLTLTGTVTTTGNLTLGGTLAVTPSNFASQTANNVLAAPNGAAGVPTFRALVDADIPALTMAKLPGAAYKQSVRCATTANLTATATTTTLTNSSTLAALVLDGITVATNDRVLVKNQTTAAQNGIYTVTNVGSASVAWVLTRTADADTADEIGAAVVNVDSGTTNGGELWTTTFKTTDTLGTTAMNWYEVLYNTGTWGISISGSAATLTTGRTIAMTGDVTYTSGSFNGSANVTGAATLANSGVTAGSYTNASVTVDAKGRVTAASSGAAPSAFPAGTVMLFAQTAAPTGWTKLTTHDNKALRVVSGTASSGGTVAFTTAFASQAVNGSIANTTAGGTVGVSGTVGNTTLTQTQVPSHRHFMMRNEYSNQANQYTITVYTNNFFAGAGAGGYEYYTANGHTSDANVGNTGISGGDGSHNHGWSGSGSFTGTAHNHTFTGTAINMAVQYVDVILASKT